MCCGIKESYFGTEHKGTGAQAMVSEINVYGAE